MMEVNYRDGGRPTHTRSTPKQTGAIARAHVVSKQILIALATNFFNVACRDASRIHSSVDNNLPEGLRAKTASPCHVPVKLIDSSFYSAGIIDVSKGFMYDVLFKKAGPSYYGLSLALQIELSPLPPSRSLSRRSCSQESWTLILWAESGCY